MNRWHRMTAAWVGLLTLVLAAPVARAETSVSFDIHVGDAYRGASLHFEREPDVVLVPRTKVYYVREYEHDLYRYGRYWYFVEEGHWYRARSWRGPFRHVHVRTVPHSVTNIPVRYRRHWDGPPAHARANGYHKTYKSQPEGKVKRSDRARRAKNRD